MEFIELTVGKTRVENGRYLSVGCASNSLATRFSALSCARESSVRFRYRLQPLFGDWRQTSQRELQFPGLPPNDYRLEVEARDGRGQWSAQPAVFGFTIRFPWWRTWSFLLLLGLVPPAAVLLILRGMPPGGGHPQESSALRRYPHDGDVGRRARRRGTLPCTGMDDYISKPIQPGALFDAIERVLPSKVPRPALATSAR